MRASPFPQLVLSTLALGLSLPALTAQAAPRGAAVVDDIQADEMVAQDLRAAIAQALRDQGLDVLPRAFVLERAASCPSGRSEREACLAKAFAAAKVAFTLYLEGRYENEAFDVKLRLFDGQGFVGEGHRTCAICTQKELYDAAADQAGLLLARAKTNRAIKPPPAAVAETPAASPLPATAWHQRPATLAGGAMAVAGVVAMGVGVRLLAIDGDLTCQPSDATCFIERHETAGLGVGWLVAGGLLTASGIGLAVWDQRGAAEGHAYFLGKKGSF